MTFSGGPIAAKETVIDQAKKVDQQLKTEATVSNNTAAMIMVKEDKNKPTTE